MVFRLKGSEETRVSLNPRGILELNPKGKTEAAIILLRREKRRKIRKGRKNKKEYSRGIDKHDDECMLPNLHLTT